jgi:hypothetical protein
MINGNDSIFHAMLSPVIILTRHIPDNILENKMMMIVNPNMGDYHIQSLIDPYKAHQDIEMFLTNNLASERDTPLKLSDTDMRNKKGFDKFSFKKEKEK